MVRHERRKTLARKSDAEPELVHARNEKGEAICGAQRMHNGVRGPCPYTDLDSHNGRCRRHGGMSTGRPAVRGRYAPKTWGRLGELVAEAETKGVPSSLTEPLLVLDGVLHRYAELAAENDSPEYRETALKLFHDWKRASEDEKFPRQVALEEHLERGANATRALQEIRTTTALLHERAEAYKKHLLAKQNALPRAQVLVFYAGLCDLAEQFMEAKQYAAFVAALRARMRSGERALVPIEVKANAVRA